MAAVVFAICINEISPSCILAPPEVVKETKGIFSSDAVSAARVTFSPTTLPMLPPMKSKSMTEIITSIPAICGTRVSALPARPAATLNRPRNMCWPRCLQSRRATILISADTASALSGAAMSVHASGTSFQRWASSAGSMIHPCRMRAPPMSSSTSMTPSMPTSSPCTCR